MKEVGKAKTMAKKVLKQKNINNIKDNGVPSNSESNTLRVD